MWLKMVTLFMLRAVNKAVGETFTAILRFGVAAPHYPETPLHNECPTLGCNTVLSRNAIR